MCCATRKGAMISTFLISLVTSRSTNAVSVLTVLPPHVHPQRGVVIVLMNCRPELVLMRSVASEYSFPDRYRR